MGHKSDGKLNMSFKDRSDEPDWDSEGKKKKVLLRQKTPSLLGVDP